ncbi:hypothetical protein Ocin01_14827 [Orchesella cincta]|uniref:Uncharacterized protein n=1 Tax=Orchesella cincta TaxID=48709 RepID=A0A1D2MFU2_ORCCI|nr:hypothetical protein Ocin01_14827 [Orchesella cincta]
MEVSRVTKRIACVCVIAVVAFLAVSEVEAGHRRRHGWGWEWRGYEYDGVVANVRTNVGQPLKEMMGAQEEPSIKKSSGEKIGFNGTNVSELDGN